VTRDTRTTLEVGVIITLGYLLPAFAVLSLIDYLMRGQP
jgi:hypothetical protein